MVFFSCINGAPNYNFYLSSCSKINKKKTIPRVTVIRRAIAKRDLYDLAEIYKPIDSNQLLINSPWNSRINLVPTEPSILKFLALFHLIGQIIKVWLKLFSDMESFSNSCHQTGTLHFRDKPREEALFILCLSFFFSELIARSRLSVFAQ